MIIRRCQQCSEYKYLPNGKHCRSCSDMEQNSSGKGCTDIILGNKQGHRVSFSPQVLHKGVAITGPASSGKTTVSTQALTQLAGNGHGFCYISADRSAKDVEKSIPNHRNNDIIWINTNPTEPTLTMNILDTYRNPSDPDYDMESNARTDVVMQLIKQSNSTHWSPRHARITHYFVENMIKSTTDYTLVDLHKILTDKKRREKFIRSHTNIPANARSRMLNAPPKEFEPIHKRVRQLIDSKAMQWLIVNKNPTFDAPRVINDNKIVLVNLTNDVRAGQRGILSYAISRLLFDELRIQNDSSNQYYLCLDGCSSLVSSKTAIENISSLARKYNFGMLLTFEDIGRMEKLYYSSSSHVGFKPGRSNSAKRIANRYDISPRLIRGLNQFEFITDLPIDAHNRPGYETGRL